MIDKMNSAQRKMFTPLGARSSSEREENDFYSTPKEAVDELLKVEAFSPFIWEPACGEGHISKIFVERGYRVKSTDLIDRGYGVGGVNFLKHHTVLNCDIVTNPPYKSVDKFIFKALCSVGSGHKVAMLLKLVTLEGCNRYKTIYKDYPPARIHVFTKRISCHKKGDVSNKGGAIAFAWFIWEKGFEGKTTIDWVNVDD